MAITRNGFPPFRLMTEDVKREYVRRLLRYLNGPTNVLVGNEPNEEYYALISVLELERVRDKIKNSDRRKILTLELILKCVTYVKNFMGDILAVRGVEPNNENKNGSTQKPAAKKQPVQNMNEGTKAGGEETDSSQRSAGASASMGADITGNDKTNASNKEQVDSQQDRLSRKHLSDYKHLLSEKLQRQSERLTELYAKLNDLHESRCRLVRMIVEEKKAGKSTGEYKNILKRYATEERQTDCTIMAFWKRVDYELMVIDGKKVPEDYKQALAEEELHYPIRTDNVERAISSYTKTEIETMESQGVASVIYKGETYTIAEITAARKERNIKYLRKKELGRSDEVRKNMYLAAEELAGWGYLLTKAMQENLQSKGVSVPAEWCRKELSKEEKAEEHRRKSREGMRRLRDDRNPIGKIKREIKEIEKETPYE